MRCLLKTSAGALAVILMSMPHAACAMEPVEEGVYLYSAAPTGDDADSRGDQAPVVFSAGRLTDGSRGPGHTVEWAGGGYQDYTICFDLLTDQPLRKVTIQTNGNPGGARNREIIAIATRAGESASLREVGRALWDQSPLIVFHLDGSPTRYVRLQMIRLPPSRLSMQEVTFYTDDGAVSRGVDLAATDPAVLRHELEREATALDQFGQYIGKTWPGKIQSDDDLLRAAQQEQAVLTRASKDDLPLDPYGGVKTGPRLNATGFFRLEQVDGRWWFVTPQGHLFFMIGVDALNGAPRKYGVNINQSDGRTPREVFESLPDRERFAPAYSGEGREAAISFLVANCIRKYGDDWEAEWWQTFGQRMNDWGFNSAARWAQAEQGNFGPGCQLPYTGLLWGGKSRIDGKQIDPFDPDWPSQIDEAWREKLAAAKDDPWLIGWVYENENGWNGKTLVSLLKQGADRPAKVAFVKFMVDHHGGVDETAKLLKVQATTIDELIAAPIDAGNVPEDDQDAFIRLASNKYYATVAATIHKHDPNHLFLGSALKGLESIAWATGGLEHLDAISFNEYTAKPWSAKKLAKYNKPVIQLEWGVGSFDYALDHWYLVENENARGLAYRQYVEEMASSPVVVGLGWFQAFDQTPIGRQSACWGIINVCDQPYQQLLDHARITNRRLYRVHSGELQPFQPQ